MPNHRYQPQQIDYLKTHYHRFTNAELAAALGISGPTAPLKVRQLARRHGVKWRAENGAPQWRAPRPDSNHTTSGYRG